MSPHKTTPLVAARAVAYEFPDDGTFTIRWATAWDRKTRLDAFPVDLRRRACDGIFSATEKTLVIFALLHSQDLAAAVYDDLLCHRATRILQAENPSSSLAKRALASFNNPPPPAVDRNHDSQELERCL